MSNNELNRRDFLIKSAKTIAVGAFAISSFDVLKLMASSEFYENHERTVEKIINVGDYPTLANVGGYAMITEKVIVIRKSSSKFIAINIVCTHKKCDVDYDGKGFECPCHGSTFNGNGKVLEGPATKNLKSYKVTYNSSDNTLTINM
ncbi:MAG: ubiquinol-cytochrome c reductase iron-sulfur subunit [Ignavibacteria bacterium]